MRKRNKVTIDGDFTNALTTLNAIAGQLPLDAPKPRPISCRDCGRALIGVAMVGRKIWVAPHSEVATSFWRDDETGEYLRDKDGNFITEYCDEIQLTERPHVSLIPVAVTCRCGKRRKLHPGG